MRTFTLSAGATMAGLLPASFAPTATTMQAPPPFESRVRPPDALTGLRKESTKVRVDASNMDGEVVFDSLERALHFTWRWKYTGELASHGWQLSHQTEATAFWPTEVASLGGNRLAVAGKARRTGHTVLHVWTMDPPSSIPPPGVEVGTGETLFPELALIVTDRDLVYDAAVPGRGLVQFMFANHGAPDEIFVQFWDSRDLYLLDMNTNDLSLVLSSSRGHGVPWVAALANDYEHRFSADHSAQGYVYVMAPAYESSDSAPDTLVLIDADRDGDLDSWRTYDEDAYSQLGLTNAEEFNAFF